MAHRILLFLCLLLVSCGIAGCAPAIIRETRLYQVYLPLVSRTADPRFSIQYGWGSNCCSAELTTLGLNANIGGNMHRQLPSNELMGIQPTEWYDWCNDPGNTDASWCRTLGLDYPPCAWVLATNDWLGIDSCAEFISENKGKTWYVGNEPNCGAGCGGWYFTPQDYASHFHSVYQAVKELDSTARVITAAWINNCYQWDATDGLMIDTYYDQWGTMPADAYNIHYYQSYTPTNPDGIAYVQCFLDNLAQKKLEGKVSSDKVRITEFGWLGFDEEHGTEENVLAFMNYLIPYLKTQPRIERAYWWQWAYYTFFFRDGAITPAGKTYQERAR